MTSSKPNATFASELNLPPRLRKIGTDAVRLLADGEVHDYYRPLFDAAIGNSWAIQRADDLYGVALAEIALGLARMHELAAHTHRMSPLLPEILRCMRLTTDCLRKYYDEESAQIMLRASGEARAPEGQPPRAPEGQPPRAPEGQPPRAPEGEEKRGDTKRPPQ